MAGLYVKKKVLVMRKDKEKWADWFQADMKVNVTYITKPHW